jgi:ribosomal protein L40E
MDEWNGVVLFLMALIGLVMLFAQLKLFSIDSTLKRILSELERQSHPLPTQETLAEPLQAEAPSYRLCSACGGRNSPEATICRCGKSDLHSDPVFTATGTRIEAIPCP